MPGELPKILYCSFEVLPEPSGRSVRSTELLRGLTPHFHVDGLTLKAPDLSHIERYYGMRLMRVPVAGTDLMTRAQSFERAVRRQVESDDYAAVHFTDPHAGYALCERRQDLHYKVVYEVVGLPSVELRYQDAAADSDARLLARLRRLELFCLMNSDAVLVGSRRTAEMVRGLGVPGEKIHVVPTGVDVPPGPEPAPREPAPPDAPLQLVYVGSLLRWQGLPTLVRAVAVANREAPVDLKVYAPPRNPEKMQLLRLAEEVGAAAHVELLPPAEGPELSRALCAADLCAAPLAADERNGGQGAPICKIAHYLSAGRPVVASDLPIVREITDPSCAALHAPADPEHLARLLVELARDRQRLAQMGESARAFSRERLGADAMRAAVLAVYARLLPDARLPSKPRAAAAHAGIDATLTPTPTAVEQVQGVSDTDPDLAAEDHTDPSPLAAAADAGAREDTETERRLPVSERIPEELASADTAPKARVPPAGPPAEPAPEPDPRPPATLRGLTPVSGVEPPDEWLGHLQYGYAPFGVSRARRAVAAEFNVAQVTR